MTERASQKGLLSGFTIMEILVYILILSIIAGTTSSLLFIVYRHKTWVEDRVSLNEDLRVAVKSIRDDMYLGRSVMVSDPNTFTITKPGNVTVQYTLSSGSLTRSENGAAAVLLTSTLTDVSQFDVEDISTPDTAGTIRISFTVRNYPLGSLKPPAELTLETTFSLKFI